MKSALVGILVFLSIVSACFGQPTVQPTSKNPYAPENPPDTCPKPPETTLFAWVAVIFLATACLVCLIPFMVLACSSLDTIADGYPTISSFSSDPHANPTASRFILIMTCIIGGSLTSLLIEEYNSRCDEDFRFFIEVSACAFLPAVGIFYTAGNKDSHFYNKYYSTIKCGSLSKRACKLRIAASDFLHSVAALYFMIANAAMNAIYAVGLVRKDYKSKVPHSKATMTVAVLSATTVAVLVAFISTMALLVFIPKKRTERSGRCKPCRCDCTAQDCRRCTRGVKKLFVGLFQMIRGMFHTAINGIIGCYDDCCPPFYCEEENEFQVCKNCYGDSPLKSICSDCGFINNVEESIPRSRTARRVLSIFAFFLEFSALLLVVATTAFCTLKRNNAVPWWK